MNLRRVGGLVSGALLALVVYFFTSNELNARQEGALALLILMAVWWITETIPIHWTSILPLLVIPIFHVGEGGIAGNILIATEPYVQHTIFLFLGGMFISAAMQRHQLHKRIALAVMGRVGGGPGRLLLGFMAATAFISLWISNTATAVMMVPIGLAVIKQMEAREGKALPFVGQAFMLAIAYSANIGGIGTKIGTAPNAQFAGFVQKRYGISMDFLDYLLIGLPFVMIFLPITWLVLKRMIAKEKIVGGDTVEIVRRELALLGSIKREEKIVLIYFLVACALWIGGKPIGDLTGLGERYDAVVALAITLLLFLTPTGRGEFLVDRSAFKTISWSALILLGGSFSLANAIQVSELSPWFGKQLGGVCAVDPLLLMFIISFLTVFMSAFTSNTATCAVLLAVVADSLRDGGVGAIPYLAAVTIGASCDFMLPCGTPPNAIVFGTKYVRMSDMVKTGAILDILASIVVALWSYFVVRFLL